MASARGNRFNTGGSQQVRFMEHLRPHLDDSSSDDESEEEDDDDQELALSKRHGEADEVPTSASNPKKRPASTALENLYAKDQTKEKTPRPKLTIPMLTGPEGLIRIPTEFKTIPYRRRPPKKDDVTAAAAYSRTLMKKYASFCYDLFASMAFEDVLLRIEALGSKKEVKAYLQNMRERVRDEHVEKLFGKEKALKMLQELELGLQRQAEHMNADDDDVFMTERGAAAEDRADPRATVPPSSQVSPLGAPARNESVDAEEENEAAFDQDDDDKSKTENNNNNNMALETEVGEKSQAQLDDDGDDDFLFAEMETRQETTGGAKKKSRNVLDDDSSDEENEAEFDESAEKVPDRGTLTTTSPNRSPQPDKNDDSSNDMQVDLQEKISAETEQQGEDGTLASIPEPLQEVDDDEEEPSQDSAKAERSFENDMEPSKEVVDDNKEPSQDSAKEAFSTETDTPLTEASSAMDATTDSHQEQVDRLPELSKEVVDDNKEPNQDSAKEERSTENHAHVTEATSAMEVTTDSHQEQVDRLPELSKEVVDDNFEPNQDSAREACLPEKDHTTSNSTETASDSRQEKDVRLPEPSQVDDDAGSSQFSVQWSFKNDSPDIQQQRAGLESREKESVVALAQTQGTQSQLSQLFEVYKSGCQDSASQASSDEVATIVPTLTAGSQLDLSSSESDVADNEEYETCHGE